MKRIGLPPALGGGDFVMKTLTIGEYEDRLKAHAAAGLVDTQSELIMSAVVAFRGRPLPAGTDREAWWRSQPLPIRQMLRACYERLNTIDDKEINSFFDAATEEAPTSPAR